jgi:hypothetical protein
MNFVFICVIRVIRGKKLNPERSEGSKQSVALFF